MVRPPSVPRCWHARPPVHRKLSCAQTTVKKKANQGSGAGAKNESFWVTEPERRWVALEPNQSPARLLYGPAGCQFGTPCASNLLEALSTRNACGTAPSWPSSFGSPLEGDTMDELLYFLSGGLCLLPWLLAVGLSILALVRTRRLGDLMAQVEHLQSDVARLKARHPPQPEAPAEPAAEPVQEVAAAAPVATPREPAQPRRRPGWLLPADAVSLEEW